MIIITNKPSTFQPAGNPLIWQFFSDNPNLVYFRFDVRVPPNNVITVLDLYPTPAEPLAAHVNISSIIKNYVFAEFKDYASNFIDTFSASILPHRVNIRERINNAGTIENGVLYDSIVNDLPYLGELDSITFKNLTQNDYVINATTPIKFMTTKPDKAIVNDYSNEGLYFLQNNYSNTLSVKFDFFNSAGISIGTHTVALPNQSTICQYRLNCSLKYLKAQLTSINFSTLSYYTVKIIDSTSATKSEVRTYHYQKLPCHLFPVNIIWLNKFGVYDTIQLYQPEETFSATKSSIKLNPYKKDDTMDITNYSGNAFNVVEQVINSTSERSVKLNTAVLSNSEQASLSGIVNSKQIYLQVDEDLFVPVVLADSSFNLRSTNTLTEPNIKQLSFKLPDGFTSDVPLMNVNI